MPARIALRATLAAAAVLLSLPPALGKAETRTAPFPPLPNIIWELYLPQEYDACTALYPLYSDLPQSDLGTLHRGEKVYLDGKSLPADTAAKLASWFNSARFGCDPPAERLDTDAVHQAVMVWKCEDNVVDFCLRSPPDKSWKNLTVACSPHRSQWVRDGLPLLPHWIYVPWQGGHNPPRPEQSGFDLRWQSLQGAYRVYAEQAPERLRTLHTQHELRLKFRDLPSTQEEALTHTIDAFRLLGNKAFGQPLEWRRTPEARAKHFGITAVVFTYRRSHPDLPYPLETNLPGIDPCPPPFKQVFVTVDDTYPPVTGWGGDEHTFVIALPSELQRSLLAWRRQMDDWIEEGEHTPNPPPWPRHPPAPDTQATPAQP